MLPVRSIAFAVAFYVATALILLGGIWLLVSPRSWAMAGLKFHGRVVLWLQRWIVGTRMEVRGLQAVPPGPVLIAAKHQSAWDTFSLVTLFRDPALVMKQELLRIPVYGWFCKKFGMIPILRQKGPSALREMKREALARAGQGREVLIFPEGTRTAPGAPPAYLPGITLLYDALKVPVYPLALNSGLYWPRKSWLRYPGTIVIEIGDPIPPGLPKREFLARLEAAIEPASARLIAEAAACDTPPPIPLTAKETAAAAAETK